MWPISVGDVCWCGVSLVMWVCGLWWLWLFVIVCVVVGVVCCFLIVWVGLVVCVWLWCVLVVWCVEGLLNRPVECCMCDYPMRWRVQYPCPVWYIQPRWWCVVFGWWDVWIWLFVFWVVE